MEYAFLICLGLPRAVQLPSLANKVLDFVSFYFNLTGFFHGGFFFFVVLIIFLLP